MALILTAGALWLVAALVVTSRRGLALGGAARVALVVTGVPYLGWVTYGLGPLAGLGGLLIGAAVLMRCRLPRLTGRGLRD
ncbi:DUF2484 family protein [Falsigemmobacter faecalis]|nr:DUF2484 family protein [Falsigemmobacter faecalis]